MKKCYLMLITCLLAAVAVILLAAGSSAQSPPSSSTALRLELSEIAGEQPGVFRLELENAGDKDLMLNLGMMLANGKVMIPDAVQLVLVDANGESKELFFSDRRHPGVMGRIDDFVVPLRAGSTYSLRLSLNDYWCPKTKEFKIMLDPGQYRLQAVLDAKEATHINLDTEGMKLMNFWVGTLRSTPIVFYVRK